MGFVFDVVFISLTYLWTLLFTCLQWTSQGFQRTRPTGRNYYESGYITVRQISRVTIWESACFLQSNLLLNFMTIIMMMIIIQGACGAYFRFFTTIIGIITSKRCFLTKSTTREDLSDVSNLNCAYFLFWSFLSMICWIFFSWYMNHCNSL